MNEKQKQTVGNGSNAIQVNGDLVLAPNYDQVKSMFLDLFELNFPKIQAIAKNEAETRVNMLLKSVEKSFEKHKDLIDSKKFYDPGIQYEMQEMSKSVARLGSRSNFELLSEVFASKLHSDCSEIMELVSAEALRVIPQLTKMHITLLSVMVVASDLFFQPL